MERVAQLYAISESSPPSLPSPSSSPSSSSSALSLLSPRATKERSVGPLKITIVTIGSRGDVQPFIALALELKKHGHTPRIATHKPFEEFVTGFGIEFFAIGGDPKDLMDLCVKHDMFSVAFVRQGLSSFKGFIDELFRDTYAACKDWAEAIIATPPSMAGYHVAEALKIPYYVGFTMPFTRTAYYPSPFAVPSSPMPHSYNLATHMMLEQMLWIPIMPQINRFRAEVLNLPPYGVTESTPAFLHTKRVPHLYCFSKYLVPKPPDWSEEINITGFWFLDNSVKDYTPPADLLAFIAAGPCVYIGFGSITIPNPKALSLLVINACKKAKIRAILSKGWGGLGDEVEFPDSFFLVGAVPHDWLFPQMTAVCHHGGAGTTAAALRARKPSVTVSFFGDQYFWGQQITERNVGRTLSFSSITEDALAAALTAVTTDPLIRDAAAFVGAQIAAEKGAECAVAAFHRHLQYAYVPPAYQHSATCHLCRTPFTLLNRRHHCRNCGLSVCNQCSETRMAIPKFYHHTEVRVCDACNARLTSSAEPLHSSNSSVPELLRSAHRRPSGSGSASAASAAAPVALPSSSSEPLLSSAAVAAAGGPSPSTPTLSSSSPPGADPLAGVRTAQSAVTHETSRRSGLRLSDQAELVVTSYALRRLWCAETTTNSGLLWQPLDEGEQFVLLEHRTGFKSRPYRVVHKDTRLCVASGTRLRDLRLVLSLFALVADALRGVDRATLIALSGALEAAFDEPANDDPTELFTATVAAFFLQRAHAKPARKE